MVKIILTLGLILFICLLFWNKSAVEKGYIIVQPDIVNNPAFNKLDKLGEPVDEIGWDTSKMKPKTTDLFYCNNLINPFGDSTRAKLNRCLPYIHSDTLDINIGLSYGFGGSGFNIIYTDKKYNIIPYQTSDQVGIEKPKSAFQIIRQSLILNKEKYKLGDSIFGYVNFKLIENKKITHIGKGYFRGKVN